MYGSGGSDVAVDIPDQYDDGEKKGRRGGQALYILLPWRNTTLTQQPGSGFGQHGVFKTGGYHSNSRGKSGKRGLKSDESERRGSKESVRRRSVIGLAEEDQPEYRGGGTKQKEHGCWKKGLKGKGEMGEGLP
jgi:hypothetical protein